MPPCSAETPRAPSQVPKYRDSWGASLGFYLKNALFYLDFWKGFYFLQVWDFQFMILFPTQDAILSSAGLCAFYLGACVPVWSPDCDTPAVLGCFCFCVDAAWPLLICGLMFLIQFGLF